MSKSYRKTPCLYNAHPKELFKSKRYWNKKRRQNFKNFIDEEGIPDMPRHCCVGWPLKTCSYKLSFFTICKKVYAVHTNLFLIPYSKDLFSRRTGYKIPKNLQQDEIRCVRSLKFK